MADYDLEAKITADASGYEAGVKKAEKASKKLSTTVSSVIKGLGKNGLVGALGAVGLASSGLSATLGSVIKVARKVSETMNECTNAYKNQLIAERALDTAIQNNPFITGSSSKALKEFASEMQKVSNYGDEELIPMMTNLVSLGRTESEVMQIMSVAMDMSAGMGISLDTAITQLNATLNGNIGRLGQQNSELKDLTEEELKQGKAIEILGEKFKGLSSATADTSKQLQNIKGDFKEALGQFTLPSSDMWNKFWTGFYERGIEVIGKINAYIDAQTIGRKLASEYVKQIKAISTEKVYNPETGIYDVRDLGARVKYIREALKALSDEELEALNNYLSSQRRLNDEEQQLLNRIKAEQDSRYQGSVNAKKEAEAKKEQAVAEEKITAEVQKQEEIAKKKTDWASKLLDQRIEMLETERDRAIQNAEEEGKESYTIWRDYNEKILELKLQRLEEEKNKSLQEEGLTEEDKIAIEEYYSGETKKIYDELGKYKKKKNEEEKKEEKSKFKIILEYMAQYAKKVAEIISKVAKNIANVAKDVISKVGSIFKGSLNVLKNVFKFNPDDALNSLLAIEDAILTFFVETLPKLPSFFSSAIQSIISLIQTLLNAIDWDKVQEIINSVIDIIVENAPQIVNDLVDLVIHIAQTLLNAIIHFVESGGWKTLLDLLLDIQKKIENFFIENIDEIVNTIADMIPDLIEFLKNSIVSASKTLGKLAPKILPLIADLINAIIEVITSDEVLESFFDALEGIVEGLIVAIIKLFTKGVPKLLNFAIKLASPQNLMKIVVAIVKGLVKAFAQINWGEVVKDIFTAFIDGIKELFGIHSPSTLFEEFGTYMVEGLVNGLKGIAEAVMIILQPVINAIETIFSGLFNFISDVITSIIEAIKSINQMSFDSLEKTIENLVKAIDTISDALTNITKISFDGLNQSIKVVVDSLSNITKISFDGLINIFKTIKDILNSALLQTINSIGTALSNLAKISFKGINDSLQTLSKFMTTLFNAIGTLTSSMFVSLARSIENVGDSVGKMAQKITDAFSNLPGYWATSLFEKLITKALEKVGLLATGTQSAQSGMYLVGEAGPELVRFRGGEQVINNRNTQKVLEGMGGTTINQNVTFNNLQDTSAFAMIQQLKQYNRQLAINGIV